MCGIDRRRQTLHPIAFQVRTDGRKAKHQASEWWHAAIEAIGRKRHHLDAARVIASRNTSSSSATFKSATA